VPLLERYGYGVDAPDLPALGDDPSPLASATFQACVDRIVSRVKAHGDPVLLLGHSLGGAPISQAAEDVPEAVGKLIYLAAMLPNDGESMMSLLDKMPLFGERSARAASRPSANGDALEFDPDAVAETFCNTSPPDIAALAAKRLRPQPIAPLTTPLRLTTARWGSIPKTYIVCTQDRAVPPRTQRWFCARVPGVKILTIDTDHSPFYSNPQALADMIDGECR
jgi:pimeloyl-ACP methyl ester carboxylesterase